MHYSIINGYIIYQSMTIVIYFNEIALTYTIPTSQVIYSLDVVFGAEDTLQSRNIRR